MRYNIHNNNNSSRKDDKMTNSTTTREYLKAQGITVGKRGRFSAAAKNAISEAAKKGVVFTDTKNVK
jgi:hypothetical protein